MSKNRLFSAFALVALLGLAACGDSAEEPMEEQPEVITADPEPVSPEAVQGTVIMDTTGAGAIVDTATVPTDTIGTR